MLRGESLPECVHVSMKFRVLVASSIICERNCRPLLVVALGSANCEPHHRSHRIPLRCVFGIAVIGLAVIDWLKGPLASTNKSLAQMNKSPDMGPAIKKGSALPVNAEWEGPN